VSFTQYKNVIFADIDPQKLIQKCYTYRHISTKGH